MGKFPVEILDEAIEDARGARLWYAQRSMVAAGRFMQELDEAIEAVAEAPRRWPEFKWGTRRYRLKKFPYFVVYRVLEDRVRVVAYQHCHRRPAFWRDRQK